MKKNTRKVKGMKMKRGKLEKFFFGEKKRGGKEEGGGGQ